MSLYYNVIQKKDYQLYCDLLDLEHKVNHKWLTNESQAEKWGQEQSIDL